MQCALTLLGTGPAEVGMQWSGVSRKEVKQAPTAVDPLCPERAQEVVDTLTFRGGGEGGELRWTLASPPCLHVRGQSLSSHLLCALTVQVLSLQDLKDTWSFSQTAPVLVRKTD